MITRESDGITLSYTNAAGVKISANPNTGERYYALLVIQSAQQAALEANNHAADIYRQQLATYQVNLNAGHTTGMAPIKPLAQIVADDGTASFAPFAPPLLDPTLVKTLPSSGGQGFKPVVAVPPDRTDVLITLAMLINGKLDKLLAKEGATA